METDIRFILRTSSLKSEVCSRSLIRTEIIRSVNTGFMTVIIITYQLLIHKEMLVYCLAVTILVTRFEEPQKILVRNKLAFLLKTAVDFRDICFQIGFHKFHHRIYDLLKLTDSGIACYFI